LALALLIHNFEAVKKCRFNNLALLSISGPVLFCRMHRSGKKISLTLAQKKHSNTLVMSITGKKINMS